MWQYNGTTIRVGRSFTDDNGITHPAVWGRWTNEYKQSMGLTWLDDPVVESYDERFYFSANNPKHLDDVEATDFEGNPVYNDDGTRMINTGLKKLVSNPECPTIQSSIYVGGFIAIRALNMGCYPSISHLIENQYSARYNVHQGSCSGILCARIMNYHYPKSKENQKLISKALGNENIPASQLIRDLVSTLPGVKNEHTQMDITNEMLKEFTQWGFDNHTARYNTLCPREFESSDDIYNMITKPLADL